ncbi:DUF4198 domain-containing protein [Aquisphaera giovannonii]|nr:DUF4198 domain-containing protein [Aquisphaera giovannonii]
MSYLGVPRLHFAGTFLARPSTINNDIANYDPTTSPLDPGWNPDGDARWDLLGCQVTAAYYADGTSAASASADPIVGTPLISISSPPAKIVDLDPDQQLVSEIWGLRVRLGGPASGSLDARYRVAAFCDLWPRAQQSTGDQPLGASYQSALEDIEWPQAPASRFLADLHRASPDLLSIKFNLDGINLDQGPTLGHGRVVGTVGPASADEPKHFVLGRLLRPSRQQGKNQRSAFTFAQARVCTDRKKVIVDLGNSLPTTTPGGPIDASLIGEVELAVVDQGGRATTLGPVQYQADDWYTSTAGVQEFPDGRTLSDAQLAALEGGRLALLPAGSGGVGPASRPPLIENASSSVLRADRYVYRLNPGDEATVELYLTKAGKPLAGETIALAYAPQRLPAEETVGTPESALAFPTPTIPEKTDGNGRVRFTLKAADPGNPRQFIDGQVYGVAYSWPQEQPGQAQADPSLFVSALVWDAFTFTPPATWWGTVQPILSQYARLYPFMMQFVDLGDYGSVVANRSRIEQVMKLDPEHPGYMPVTRDLSRAKRDMILGWFAAGAPEGTPPS